MIRILSIIFALGSISAMQGHIVYSATKLGIVAGTTTIDSNITTNPILGSYDYGHYKSITIVGQVTWGTTATMEIRILVSNDGTTYAYLPTCTSTTPHNCAPRVYEFEVADGTEFALSMDIAYPYIKIEFDDPGAGNGTLDALTVALYK